MLGALTLGFAHENKNAMQTSTNNNNLIFIPILANEVLFFNNKIQKMGIRIPIKADETFNPF
jgi:hypothetical protein